MILYSKPLFPVIEENDDYEITGSDNYLSLANIISTHTIISLKLKNDGFYNLKLVPNIDRYRITLCGDGIMLCNDDGMGNLMGILIVSSNINYKSGRVKFQLNNNWMYDKLELHYFTT